MREKIYCKSCEYVGLPAYDSPKVHWLEILIAILFFPWGLIYLIFKAQAANEKCPVCDSPNVIPSIEAHFIAHETIEDTEIPQPIPEKRIKPSRSKVISMQDYLKE